MATRKKQEKEIVRAIRFNSVLFEPGMEDELEEAIKNHADDDEEFDEQEELERLTKMGALIGFAEVDDEDLVEQDADRRAVHQSGNRAVLQHRQPLAKMGRGPKSLDEAQHEPDVNKVDFAKSKGKPPKAPKADRAGRQKLEDLAQEQKDESELQQESDQIPTPGSEEEE